TQRLIAVAPLVAGPGVPVDDERGDAELTQSCPERDTALPATDDEHIRLGVGAEARVLGLPAFEPRHSLGIDAVLGAGRPPLAARFLVPLELLQRREECPRLRSVLVDEPNEADTAPDRRFELEPGGRHPVHGLGWF